MKNKSVQEIVATNLNSLSWDELVGLAMNAREANDFSRWLLGDIAKTIVLKFGFEALDKFARQSGVTKNSMLRYKTVSESIPAEVREKFPKLSWSHFRAVTTYKEPEKILEKADDENWSVEKTAVEIKKEKLGVKELILRPRIINCDHCPKYVILDTDSLCEYKGKHYEK